MSESTTTIVHTGGIGFFGLLTIVFVTLKLFHVINWSWWWVLSPLIFSFCATIFILLALILIYLTVRD
jgi:hypothetical protein